MTAPIVSHYEGRVEADPEGICASMEWSSADVTTRVRSYNGGPAWRGQLWERIAEGKAQRTATAREELNRGPRAAWPDMGLRDRSGIIRAGKRVTS